MIAVFNCQQKLLHEQIKERLFVSLIYCVFCEIFAQTKTRFKNKCTFKIDFKEKKLTQTHYSTVLGLQLFEKGVEFEQMHCVFRQRIQFVRRLFGLFVCILTHLKRLIELVPQNSP